eukprot:180738-Rhodomonas_salina.4
MVRQQLLSSLRLRCSPPHSCRRLPPLLCVRCGRALMLPHKRCDRPRTLYRQPILLAERHRHRVCRLADREAQRHCRKLRVQGHARTDLLEPWCCCVVGRGLGVEVRGADQSAGRAAVREELRPERAGRDALCDLRVVEVEHGGNAAREVCKGVCF